MIWARNGLAAPLIAKGAVLTVSTWGGVTQDAIAKNVGPVFIKATGATLAFDIGAQGPRYSKLLASQCTRRWHSAIEMLGGLTRLGSCSGFVAR